MKTKTKPKPVRIRLSLETTPEFKQLLVDHALALGQETLIGGIRAAVGRSIRLDAVESELADMRGMMGVEK